MSLFSKNINVVFREKKRYLFSKYRYQLVFIINNKFDETDYSIFIGEIYLLCHELNINLIDFGVSPCPNKTNFTDPTSVRILNKTLAKDIFGFEPKYVNYNFVQSSPDGKFHPSYYVPYDEK
jgi:hypothetical protein